MSKKVLCLRNTNRFGSLTIGYFVKYKNIATTTEDGVPLCIKIDMELSKEFVECIKTSCNIEASKIYMFNKDGCSVFAIPPGLNDSPEAPMSFFIIKRRDKKVFISPISNEESIAYAKRYRILTQDEVEKLWPKNKEAPGDEQIGNKMRYRYLPDAESKNIFEYSLISIALESNLHSVKNPVSVEKLILGNRDKSLVQQINMLSYFLYRFQGDRILSDIKMKEYTDFIGAERNRLFLNSYKNNPRKFIKHEEFGRTKTIYDYVNNYILDNTKIVKRKSLWK